MVYPIFFVFLVAVQVLGQTCENYGSQNGSSCACPPGFGGATCSQPSCGGDIFQGSLRNSTPGGNLTAGGCTCENGWTGTGCNVCQSASACQNGFVNVQPNAQLPSQTGQNDTMTCNIVPQVYAAGQMSCQVIVCFQLWYICFSFRISESCAEPDPPRCLSVVLNSQYPSHSPTIPHSYSEYNRLWIPRFCFRTVILRRSRAVLLQSGHLRSGSEWRQC
jgi:hypothetical protein